MFHEKYGHFRVPMLKERGTKRPRASSKFEGEIDEETIKLAKWVKRQKCHYMANNLRPERVAALEDIGFDFKPGNATKQERVNIQLGLLDQLRKRRELSNVQVADLNYLYDEWKRRAEAPRAPRKPVHETKSADAAKKTHDGKWDAKFNTLVQFQVGAILVFLVNFLQL